jgi:RNA polymerase sigma-70 factor (ECF subfamily)
VAGTKDLVAAAARLSVDPRGRPEFEDVYEQHVDFAWRSLARLGVRPEALEDATQELFLVVHRRLGEFEGRSALTTWLFAIALRVARRHLRDQVRHPSSAHDVAATEPDPGRSPQESAQRSEALRLLYALLDELTPEQREVFVMAELEELTAPEIAELACVPVNTVYSRLRSARGAFEQALRRARLLDDWRKP